VEPAPIINLSLKSGVELVPSHISHPVGIALVAPDHMAIRPVGTPTIPVKLLPSIAGNAPVNLLDVIVAIFTSVTFASAIFAVVTASVAILAVVIFASVTLTVVTAFVANSVVPPGLIAIWSGATNAIPTGWLICDGTNSTPDLRDRFIIGAGSTYSVGATGGSSTLDSHTLTIAELAAHTHTYVRGTLRTEGGDNAVQSAIHSTTNTGSTGSSSAHTHGGVLPPYYALAYIMKT